MEEWQPYFYLDHRDLHHGQPGKVIGLLIIFTGLIFLILQLFNINLASISLTLLYIGFGVICLFLGKIIHHEKQQEKIMQKSEGPEIKKEEDSAKFAQ